MGENGGDLGIAELTLLDAAEDQRRGGEASLMVFSATTTSPKRSGNPVLP
jgi:hypothetical protein